MSLKKSDRRSELEKARDDAISVLNGEDPFDEKYEAKLKHVKKLSEMVAQEAPEKLNVNTILNVAGTLVAVVAIVGHERANVLTSKALAFLPKFLK